MNFRKLLSFSAILLCLFLMSFVPASNDDFLKASARNSDLSIPVYSRAVIAVRSAPSTNGCGTEGGFPVPDTYVFGGITVSFVDACNQHDRCYGTLGTDRASCDSDLYYGMINACRQAIDLRFPINPLAYVRCAAQAGIYYVVLRLPFVGGPAYESGQNTAAINVASHIPVLIFPDAFVGQPYSETVTGINGLAPYSFTRRVAQLPTDFTLTSQGILTGVLSPSDFAETFTGVIVAKDALGWYGARLYILNTGPLPTNTLVPTNTDIPTSTQRSPTDTPTLVPRDTDTPTPPPVNTWTPTPMITNSPTPTLADTWTPTPTAPYTDTPTPTETWTPTPTATDTETPTLTPTVTDTETPMLTPTPTDTSTPTPVCPEFVNVRSSGEWYSGPNSWWSSEIHALTASDPSWSFSVGGIDGNALYESNYQLTNNGESCFLTITLRVEYSQPYYTSGNFVAETCCGNPPMEIQLVSASCSAAAAGGSGTSGTTYCLDDVIGGAFEVIIDGNVSAHYSGQQDGISGGLPGLMYGQVVNKVSVPPG